MVYREKNVIVNNRNDVGDRCDDGRFQQQSQQQSSTGAYREDRTGST